MTDTLTIRTNLLTLYPQFKPKFAPSSPEYTTEIARIDLFIDNARLECDLKSKLLDNQYDKALILLSCHDLTISQPQGFNNGSIEWEERETMKTVYSKTTVKDTPHKQTKYGQQYDTLIETLQNQSKSRFGAMLIQ